MVRRRRLRLALSCGAVRCRLAYAFLLAPLLQKTIACFRRHCTRDLVRARGRLPIHHKFRGNLAELQKNPPQSRQAVDERAPPSS